MSSVKDDVARQRLTTVMEKMKYIQRRQVTDWDQVRGMEGGGEIMIKNSFIFGIYVCERTHDIQEKFPVPATLTFKLQFIFQ